MVTLPFQRKREKRDYKEKKKDDKKKQKLSLKQNQQKKVFSNKPSSAKPSAKPSAKTTKKMGKSKIAYRVLKEPIVSEKGTRLAEEGKYLFKVFSNANKIEIKRAIEDVYKVGVEDIHIVNIPRKKKRLGRQEGWKKGYKKAIVSLKKGEKIETMPH